MFEKTPPKANITADKWVVNKKQGNGLVQFADYSVASEDASYKWHFPGTEPEYSTEERPIISYKHTKPGLYSVSLEVTDAMGQSSQELKHFIEVK